MDYRTTCVEPDCPSHRLLLEDLLTLIGSYQQLLEQASPFRGRQVERRLSLYLRLPHRKRWEYSLSALLQPIATEPWLSATATIRYHDLSDPLHGYHQFSLTDPIEKTRRFLLRLLDDRTDSGLLQDLDRLLRQFHSRIEKRITRLRQRYMAQWSVPVQLPAEIEGDAVLGSVLFPAYPAPCSALEHTYYYAIAYRVWRAFLSASALAPGDSVGHRFSLYRTPSGYLQHDLTVVRMARCCLLSVGEWKGVGNGRFRRDDHHPVPFLEDGSLDAAELNRISTTLATSILNRFFLSRRQVHRICEGLDGLQARIQKRVSGT